LSGCSSHIHRDGAPNFYVDVTKIPNAIPKKEPLSKLGNMPTYRVNGQRYYVLRSSANYEEQGIASWYGTQFNARKTSSGELYNMLSMTAAHKTLPLPTYVQVTNLANGLNIIVKVTDRGPFAANRIIDLSYVAAKKLGMLAKGTAFVDVKAIDPSLAIHSPNLLAKNKPATVLNKIQKINLVTELNLPLNRHLYPTPAKTVYLQVAAFRSKANATQLQKKLAKLFTYPVHIHTQNHIYRVAIGPLKNDQLKSHVSKKIKSLRIVKNEIKGSADFLNSREEV
jgi:rare lipoprotein A